MNPFTAFCLYVAARVFVHRLKKAPEEQEIRASLEFLLNAMHVFKRRNPLSESFLIQLSLEAQGTGLDTILHSADLSPSLMKAMVCLLFRLYLPTVLWSFTNASHRPMFLQKTLAGDARLYMNFAIATALPLEAKTTIISANRGKSF